MTVSGLALVKPNEEELARTLLQNAFRGSARAMGRLTPGRYGWLSDAIAREDVLFWNRQTGVVVLEPGSAPDRLEIKVMGLHSDLHGYGLGQAMLYTVECEIEARGYHWVELHAVQMFDHLTRFYTSQGYRITHTGPHPSADDAHHRVFFEKALTEDARAARDKPDLQHRA